jgi:hypothetical protein
VLIEALGKLSATMCEGTCGNAAHVVTQQRQNEAKLSNTDADKSSKVDPSSKVAKGIKNDKKQASIRVPKGFFRIDRIVNHRLEAGEKE